MATQSFELPFPYLSGSLPMKGRGWSILSLGLTLSALVGWLGCASTYLPPSRPKPTLQKQKTSVSSLPNEIRVGLIETLDPIVLECPELCFLNDSEGKSLPIHSSGPLHLQWLFNQGTAQASPTYWVQIGLYTNVALCERMKKEVLAFFPGLPIEIHEEKEGCRLSLGPYTNRNEAETVRARIHTHYADAWIRKSVPIQARPNRVQVLLLDRGTLLGEFNLPVTLNVISGGAIGWNGASYAGKMELRASPSGTGVLVNIIDLDTYLTGVLWKEMNPMKFPALEALKAQAVAARTYLYRNLGQFSSQGYDICATQQCQVYEGLPPSEESARALQAVMETQGEILFYEDKPALTFYASTCGGHTEDASKIFPGINEPYLKGVPCTAEPVDSLQPIVLEGPLYPAQERLPVILWLALHQDNALPQLTADLITSWINQDLQNYHMQGSPIVLPLTRVKFLMWLGDLMQEPAWEKLLLPSEPGVLREFLELSPDNLNPFVLRGLLWMFLYERDTLGTWLRDPTTSRWNRDTTLTEILSLWTNFISLLHPVNLETVTLKSVGNGELHLATYTANKKEEEILKYKPDTLLLAQKWGDSWVPGRAILVPGQSVEILRDGDTLRALIVPTPPRWSDTSDRFSVYSWWTQVVERTELEKRLQNECPGWNAPLSSLDVVEKSPWGRNLTLRFSSARGITCELSGYAIRRVLQAREFRFQLWPVYDNVGTITRVLLIGRGWGHGVGLCQVGAYGMAMQGWDYRAILAHYYPGTHVRQIPSGSVGRPTLGHAQP